MLRKLFKLSSLYLIGVIVLSSKTIPVFALYGDPTPEEQYLLELINRARANPAAEGQLLVSTDDQEIQSALEFFEVDPTSIVAEFSNYDPRPPLTFNDKLIEMARFHSEDMRDHNYQGHTGSAGDTLTDRFSLFGYDYLRAAENVFAYAKSLLYGHAGFIIDWGVESLGHRKNLLEFDRDSDFFREIGIGVVYTVSSSSYPGLRLLPPGIFSLSTEVGPIIITEDFALSATQPDTPFLLGVVYDDLNGNNFYDIGEGVQGVTISLDNGQSTVSASSGGYSLPVDSPGTYQVTASGGPLSTPQIKEVTIGQDNVKLDFLVNQTRSETSLSLSLSKSSYARGEELLLYVSIYPGTDMTYADVYLALVLPNATFRCLTDINGGFSEENVAIPLASSWPVSPVYNYPLLQIIIPEQAQRGEYQFFLILVRPNSDPLNLSNWLTYTRVSFDLS